MIEEIIFNNYGIEVEREEANSRFPSFRSGNIHLQHRAIRKSGTRGISRAP